MKCLLFLMLFVVPHICVAQKAEEDISKILIEKDSLFWVGYNTCNLDLMEKFLVKDMEFYHDKGGITRGVEGMKKAMSENICGNSNNKVRRELVPGSFKLFLMKNNNEVYGAIMSGEHYFYNSRNGAAETKEGIAKFTHLWLLKDGEWKMHRILSYDHRPASN